MEPINSIAPTIRAGLRALSLLLGATAIIGGGTSGQAIASPLDPAPFPKTTSASAKRSCPVGSVCRAARECPRGRVCLWSADHFAGAKKVVRPVPSGRCRKIGDVDGAWTSVYNASREFARLWQFTHGKPSPFGLPPITQCTGGNNLVAPHTARREVSFGGGLRGSAAAEPRSSNRRHTACSTGLLPPCPIAAPTLEAITVPVTPGAAASLAVASGRDGVGVHLSTLIMPAVLLTTPDHGDGVHAADPPGLPGKR